MTPPDDVRTDLAAGVGCALVLLTLIGAGSAVAGGVALIERLLT